MQDMMPSSEDEELLNDTNGEDLTSDQLIRKRDYAAKRAASWENIAAEQGVGHESVCQESSKHENSKKCNYVNQSDPSKPNENPMGPTRFSQANPMKIQWEPWDSVHEILWKPMELNGTQWNSNH